MPILRRNCSHLGFVQMLCSPENYLSQILDSSFLEAFSSEHHSILIIGASESKLLIC